MKKSIAFYFIYRKKHLIKKEKYSSGANGKACDHTVHTKIHKIKYTCGMLHA